MFCLSSTSFNFTTPLCIVPYLKLCLKSRWGHLGIPNKSSKRMLNERQSCTKKQLKYQVYEVLNNLNQQKENLHLGIFNVSKHTQVDHFQLHFFYRYKVTTFVVLSSSFGVRDVLEIWLDYKYRSGSR